MIGAVQYLVVGGHLIGWRRANGLLKLARGLGDDRLQIVIMAMSVIVVILGSRWTSPRFEHFQAQPGLHIVRIEIKHSLEACPFVCWVILHTSQVQPGFEAIWLHIHGLSQVLARLLAMANPRGGLPPLHQLRCTRWVCHKTYRSSWVDLIVPANRGPVK
jgi:hypothetical protein